MKARVIRRILLLAASAGCNGAAGAGATRVDSGVDAGDTRTLEGDASAVADAGRRDVGSVADATAEGDGSPTIRVADASAPEPSDSAVVGDAVAAYDAAAIANGLVVAADDPAIQYAGRIDFTDPKRPAFAYPNERIAIEFTGTRADVVWGATATDYVDVAIDGAWMAAPLVVGAEAQYAIVRGLAPTKHTLVLWKRTESLVAQDWFKGFVFDASATVSAPPPRSHRVLFIGDSITCGYGDLVSVSDPSTVHFTADHENGRLAYDGLVAEAFDAALETVAYSGRGLERNGGGSPGATLPEIYPLTKPDSATPAWDPTRFVPELIVINLGTNDFSSNPNVTAGDAAAPWVDANHAAYRTAYADFLKTLRGQYPKAMIVCALGPMINDYYPPGEQAWTRGQSDVNTVVEAAQTAGDTNVFSLFFAPQSAPYGEDYHPTAAEQATMAAQVEAMVTEKLGWATQ